jgi:hypothetical protein
MLSKQAQESWTNQRCTSSGADLSSRCCVYGVAEMMTEFSHHASVDRDVNPVSS